VPGEVEVAGPVEPVVEAAALVEQANQAALPGDRAPGAATGVSSRGDGGPGRFLHRPVGMMALEKSSSGNPARLYELLDDR
jgi:hypothetical protein